MLSIRCIERCMHYGKIRKNANLLHVYDQYKSWLVICEHKVLGENVLNTKAGLAVED